MRIHIHRIAVALALIITCSLSFSSTPKNKYQLNTEKEKEEIIFSYGGEINKPFIKYVVKLTNKPKPKICFIPTASLDNPYVIIHWYQLCHDLSVELYTLFSSPNSYYSPESYDEILAKMDAIIVGGGNTLNMMAIWKVQGIDSALFRCLKKGTVLAGGSAGAICLFENGISDSRPKSLSLVDGLSFLKYSTCPHYNNEKGRKELYDEMILNKKMRPGFACDDDSGVLFINGKFIKSVSLNNNSNSYYISAINGKILEQKLPSEIIK